MKIKKGFILREVAGSNVVVCVDGELSFNGMITLNETGAFIWKQLEKELSNEDIARELAASYEVDFETALSDINRFTEKMNEAGILEG